MKTYLLLLVLLLNISAFAQNPAPQPVQGQPVLISDGTDQRIPGSTVFFKGVEYIVVQVTMTNWQEKLDAIHAAQEAAKSDTRLSSSRLQTSSLVKSTNRQRWEARFKIYGVPTGK